MHFGLDDIFYQDKFVQRSSKSSTVEVYSRLSLYFHDCIVDIIIRDFFVQVDFIWLLKFLLNKSLRSASVWDLLDNRFVKFLERLFLNFGLLNVYDLIRNFGLLICLEVASLFFSDKFFDWGHHFAGSKPVRVRELSN
jgi:hypothetical protein